MRFTASFCVALGLNLATTYAARPSREGVGGVTAPMPESRRSFAVTAAIRARLGERISTTTLSLVVRPVARSSAFEV
jgi:hypothetical protein